MTNSPTDTPDSAALTDLVAVELESHYAWHEFDLTTAVPAMVALIRERERAALTALAAEHAARTTHGGLVADMHLMAQKRAEAYRDTFYPQEQS